jgi:hypothetical protein
LAHLMLYGEKTIEVTRVRPKNMVCNPRIRARVQVPWILQSTTNRPERIAIFAEITRYTSENWEVTEG